MVKFKETRPEDKRGAEEMPVWHKTRRGVLIAIFFILLCLLFWKVWGKPKWIKIEVSNIYVALLAVGFAYLFLRILRVRSRVFKLISGLLWLLFLPNTAYLFTSLGHVIYQWNNTISPSARILLLVQYLLLGWLGIITFLFSFLPFEKIIDRVSFFKKRKVTWLILFNFLVAFGMVLGRFEHINSWLVFTNPLKVLALAINIFVSIDLLRLFILFGLICNLIYFLFRGLFLKRINNYF